MSNQIRAVSNWSLFNFRRLFWRIFFGFWLSSVAIMIATTYVLTGEFEGNQLIKDRVQELENHASVIIENFEIGEVSATFIDWPSHRRSATTRASNKRPPTFSIYNSQRSLIYGSPRRTKKANELSLKIESNTGELYYVYSRKPRVPHFIKNTIYKLNSIQLVFILIVSTIISALLSWSITTPLKRLSLFSQQYSRNHSTQKIDESLLRRKDEVGALASDISNMMMTIESTLSAQKQLLHDVSHELRAPLSRLQVCVALLEQKNPDHAHKDRIDTEFSRINQLIQQILDYSRQGENAEPKKTIDLVVFINEIADNLSTEYTQQKFSITSSQHSIMYRGYQASLNSAFENILQNACKHSIQAVPITVDIREEDKRVIVTVMNYGKSINEAELSKILKPFYRAGNIMHTEGFGLGLSIANKAIQKHDGHLRVENHSDGGVIVTCELPVTMSIQMISRNASISPLAH